MKNSLKHYFTFASRDRRAILLLTGLIVVSLLVPFALPYLVSDNTTNFSEFSNQIAQYKEDIKQQEAEINQKGKQPNTNSGGSAITQEIAAFNPNTLTAQKAEDLGLPPKVAANIEKYLQKGGKFKKPDDFAKIYGMTNADFQRLQPYLIFEDNGSSRQAEQPSVIARKTLPPLSPFDPNTLTAQKAEDLGLPPKVAANIEKYLQKGGKFKKPDDFAKIYGMTNADYSRLQPYITIAPNPGAVAANTTGGKEKIEKMEFSDFSDPDMPKPATKKNGIKIDINTASAEEWDKLPGIGATYANMIVNFRTKLGGFTNIEQVKETRGLPEETYNLIVPHLMNNSPQSINKININAADAATLSKHPYIYKDVAQSIVNIRKQHGNYTSVEGIKKSKLVDETLYRKIAPYLSITD
ncbi:helix-hairpin-helix domain-containing protein [Sphingobacteriales bacterium UPWRP_1]|nr:hypothetical protein B6N25_00830 [Sphingobacteriales bacterium TSM_CSS]PSJ72223.1 helix-hairpin-helix domain-containing protein [Sphingobacteriales bacterium UPWRP_1]